MKEVKQIKMDIDKENLLIILSDYFSEKLGDDCEAVPDIVFFIKEVISNGKVTATTTTYLDQNDLEEAIKDYVSSSDYEFESFKYKGGVRLAGYFRDEYEEAYFEGLDVKLKEKAMQRRLR